MSSANDYLEVADAVDSLPDDLKAQLALGPMEEPDCRICGVLHAGCLFDAAEIILEFHELGYAELAEAARGVLGTDQKLSNHETKMAAAYKDKVERLPVRHVQRLTIESLAGNILWYRCLYVYMLAGWRP